MNSTKLCATRVCLFKIIIYIVIFRNSLISYHFNVTLHLLSTLKLKAMLENVNGAQKPTRVKMNSDGLKSTPSFKRTSWTSLGIVLFLVMLSFTSFGQKQKIEFDKKNWIHFSEWRKICPIK